MNIMKSRGILREGVRCIMGNGHNIRFWEDNWLGGKLLAYRKFRRLMEKLKEEMDFQVVDYIEPRRNWKRLRKDNCPLGDVPLLEELEEMMNAQRLPLSIQEDKLVWDKASNGHFTIKLSYTHLFYNDLCPTTW